MNLSFVGWRAAPSHDSEHDDDPCNDWLGGEAWVTPQPFEHEGIRATTRPRGEAYGTDWNPL